MNVIALNISVIMISFSLPLSFISSKYLVYNYLLLLELCDEELLLREELLLNEEEPERE